MKSSVHSQILLTVFFLYSHVDINIVVLGSAVICFSLFVFQFVLGNLFKYEIYDLTVHIYLLSQDQATSLF